MSLKPLVVSVAALAIIGVGGWVAFRVGAEPPPLVDSPAPAAGARPVVPSSPSVAGASASSSPAADAAAVGATPPSEPPEADPIGVAPRVAATANANVASVVEAVRTGKHPERLSPLMVPPPFNPEAFAQNPAGYLAVVEPGRVFQTATPKPGVPVLTSVGTATRAMSVGDSCDLVVRTAPHAPVSFTTMDLGTFPNGLTSISVQADESGLAKTVFAANGGVVAGVNVLAGSPLASGQVHFHITVTEKSAVSVNQ